MDQKKTVVVSLVALATAAMLYYTWLKTKAVGLSEKNSRSLSFSTSYCSTGLSGMDYSLPATEQGFYSDAQMAQISSKIANIRAQYGDLIANTENLTRVPQSVITSFIFIESAGNPSITSGNAVGLMQVGSNSATDIVLMEYKQGRLGDGETAILKNSLGTRIDSILAMRSLGTAQYITKDDLLDPELNILIGSMLLGQLIDESIQQDGTLRMDKVVVRYNMGYYAYSRGKTLPTTVADTINTVNSTTSQYIVKLIGKNGVLELLESEKCGQ